jgi:hypothetical protein
VGRSLTGAGAAALPSLRRNSQPVKAITTTTIMSETIFGIFAIEGLLIQAFFIAIKST